MRVLHVVDRVAALGGVQTYLGELLPALSECGFENMVLVGDGEPGSFAGSPVRVVPALLLDGATLPKEGRLALRSVVEHAAPAAAYLHIAPSPAVVTELSGLVETVVAYAHDYFMTCPGNARYLHRRRTFCAEGVGARCFVRAYTERTTNRRPDRIVRAYRRVSAWQSVLPQVRSLLVASEFAAGVLVDAGAPAANVKVIPYPVAARSGRPADADPTDVLFVGRLVAAKGVDVLLEALAGLPAVSAIVAGEGPERSRLERSALRLDIADRVRFAGWVDAGARDELLARARSFVMPSLWEEPFGIAGLEALAAGVPVVASAVGGIPSWLHDGEAGLLVPANDADALRAALGRVLGDDMLHERLGLAGPEVASRFSMARHLELLLPELRPS